MIESRDLKYWKKEIKKYDNKINNSFREERDRIKLSENLLIGMRNFISSIECYIHKSSENKIFCSRYEEIKKANDYCKKNDSLNFLSKFYDNLNASVGHEDFIGEYAERLALKYITKLFKVKDFLFKKFNINVLSDLTIFPLDLDDSFKKYYKKILDAMKINNSDNETIEKGTYYIQKKKLIYIDNTLFYEYVFTDALDNNSKFNRFITFSMLNIPTNYSIQAISVMKKIVFFNQNISYMVIRSYNIAIRPCEIEKLSYIVDVSNNYNSKSNDYYKLMEYLKNSGTNLVDIIKMDDNSFLKFKHKIFSNRTTIISKTLEVCRLKIRKKELGFRTLLYLLYTMNNDILYKQIALNNDESIGNIKLKTGVYAFEKTPFSSGLLNHVPSFKNLVDIFGYDDHKTDILARTVANFSNEFSCIYIPNKNISCGDFRNVIDLYNSKFNKKSLEQRKILQIGDYTYIAENEINTIEVLKKLTFYTNCINFPYYESYAISRISELGFNFDDNDKKKALTSLFEKGSLYAIYGAAGTGKSFFANYVLKLFKEMIKVCIAPTNPAVENMKRKFGDVSANYLTVTKYLLKYNEISKIDLLIIDECSMISTKDICSVLRKTKPKLILLLGDIFQIPSISFGNWFALMRSFIPDRCFIDLKMQYRSGSETLTDFWREVRDLGPNIQEKLAMYEISSVFNDSLFKKNYDDEIILCLNYDGLYGINNLNKVMQNANKNKPFKWKQYVFKVGDPIIFNDNARYKDIFYNNLKGTIVNIDEDEKSFKFVLKVNKVLNSLLCRENGIGIISIEGGESVISLTFNKYNDDIYDRDTGDFSKIPFQISYALSIHKVQGLEYDSVKIIISNEVEENITHNIFYTAITRAKQSLTIYWTPETEKRIINSFKILNYNTDVTILKQRLKA